MTRLGAKWISVLARPGRRAAPLFRREFMVSGPIASATLNICGVGYYEAWINQRRVGDHVLDPAQTDYRKRVFYVSYDVAELICEGNNCIGVVLGNGWYNQDRVWAKGNGLSYGPPALLLGLTVTFADGSMSTVKSDETWSCAQGPITTDNIYAGETYDARLELPGWDAPGFDDTSWDPVSITAGPEGKLEPQIIPPIRKIEELIPVKIDAIASDGYVVDLGQNISGWARIQLEAPAGTEVQMRFAESITGDGSIDTASTGVFATGVEQIDRYICKGTGVEQWEPRFTYHGFRYIEVSGWPGEFTHESITGVVVHTDLAEAGSFECSDNLLNQLHRMALWTHRNNIHGIPEDCPARERCGWLGDANLVAEYSLWNFDAFSFWGKFLDDIETTCADNNGIPCNVAPGRRCTSGNAEPDWAAAFIMLPWYLYLESGASSVLGKHWPGMEHLIAFFGEQADGWILSGGYGDFFDPGTDSIVQHTPQALTTSLWFYRCTEVMASCAQILGHGLAASRYSDWKERIASAVTKHYFDSAQGTFGSQSADAMALAFGLLPAEEDRILAALVADIRKRDTHPNVGVMGVRFLFEVLTRRGHGELALALMRQDTYPSFGHLIGRGATTLWECWGEEEHNGTHGPRSLNHPFMGGYDNWFYNTLAGIRIDEGSPGFTHFFLEPHPVPGLGWVRCHHDCRNGRIVSNWRLNNGQFEWRVVVPQDTRATATLPFTGCVKELDPGTYKLVDQEG